MDWSPAGIRLLHHRSPVVHDETVELVGRNCDGDLRAELDRRRAERKKGWHPNRLFGSELQNNMVF
jgi:hypothetical protein